MSLLKNSNLTTLNFVNKKEKALLEEFCFGVKANSKNCAGAKLNADIGWETSNMDR